VVLEARVSSPLRLAKEARKHGTKQLPAAVFRTAEVFCLCHPCLRLRMAPAPLLALDSGIVFNSDALCRVKGGRAGSIFFGQHLGCFAHNGNFIIHKLKALPFFSPLMRTSCWTGVG
jgi:hypothetical protein